MSVRRSTEKALGVQCSRARHVRGAVWDPFLSECSETEACRHLARVLAGPGRSPKRQADNEGVQLKIKAAVLRDGHGPFSVEELELGEPGPDEVLVRVVAAGMCHHRSALTRAPARVLPGADRLRSRGGGSGRGRRRRRRPCRCRRPRRPVLHVVPELSGVRPPIARPAASTSRCTTPQAADWTARRRSPTRAANGSGRTSSASRHSRATRSPTGIQW